MKDSVVHWKCNHMLAPGLPCPIRVKSIGANRPSEKIDQHPKHLPIGTILRAEWEKYRTLNRSKMTTEKPRTVITQVQRDMPMSCATLVPNKVNMAQCIRYHRRKQYGKEPKTRKEIIIPVEFHRTIEDVEDGSSELFYIDDSGEDDEERIMLFSTETNIKWLMKHHEWYVDGTFEIAPDLFKQLFTIQIVVNGYNLPLVYALLPNKKTETYQRMLDMLAEHAEFPPDLPSKIHWRCDFELGIWSAIENSRFGNQRETIIEACYFHYAANLWNNVSKKGLIEVFRKMERFQSNFRLLYLYFKFIFILLCKYLYMIFIKQTIESVSICTATVCS
jgi:hypothetical protein